MIEKKNVVDPATVPAISAEGQQSSALIIAEQVAELNTLMKVCSELNKSGMFPQLRNNGQVLAVVLAGKERNYGPMTSLTNIHVIRGRIGYSAQLIASELHKAGVHYDIIHTDTKRCKLRFMRKGRESFEYEWTLEDAQRAKKLPADPDSVWSTYPQDMLFARCLTAGGRKFAPDALMGAYLVDELPASDAPGEPGDDSDDRRTRTQILKDKLTNGQKPEAPSDDPPPADEPGPEPPETGPAGGAGGEEEKKTAELQKFHRDVLKLDPVCRNQLCPNKGTAFGGKAEGHHIKKRSQGGLNIVGNGIGLCRGCHTLVEAGGLFDGEKMTAQQIMLAILEQWVGTNDWRWEGVYLELKDKSQKKEAESS